MSIFTKNKPVQTGHYFINYLGLPGAGKTLSVVENELIPRYLLGQLVRSNTFINLKGIKYFTEAEELKEFKNCVCFVDEIGQFIDPYAWKDMSYEVRRWFSNHRKFHVDILSTTQDISQICKPARILISDYVFTQNDSNTFLSDLLGFRSKTLCFIQKHLSYQDLSRLSRGLGASGADSEVEADSDLESYSESISFNEVDLPKEIKPEKVYYNTSKLIHHELDDFKIELVHYYCPKCFGRQHVQILKADTLDVCDYNPKTRQYKSKIDVYCPNHPAQLLELRESGIYDTDYLIAPPKRDDIVFVPMVPSEAGHTLVRYKGYVDPKLPRPSLSGGSSGFTASVGGSFHPRGK